jgi:hypothetical protein
MRERTHCSTDAERIVLRAVDPKNDKSAGAFKPAGFWYQLDGDWERWCRAEGYGEYTHLHKIDLADARVLQIQNVKQLDEFHRTFGRVAPWSATGRMIEIQWDVVARSYDGVEIAPYQWERRLNLDFMWYYGWDCASGVIWNPRHATVKLIGELKKEEKKYATTEHQPG